MKLLLKVKTGMGYLWRIVDEDEAEDVMDEYASVGWNCKVVSEAVIVINEGEGI